MGGSIALKDAEELVDVLLSSTELGGSGMCIRNGDTVDILVDCSEGSIDLLLPKYHETMMHRAVGHIRDAKRRLSLSHKRGWASVWQRALLRVMNLCWPLAEWVSGVFYAES